MKKLMLLIGFLLISQADLHSQLMEENFEYPAGDSLAAHDWTAFSGGSTNRILVTSPGLNFATYSGSGIGNSTFLTNTGQDVYKNFVSAKDTLSLYISFMVNVTNARSGDYFAALLPSTSTALFTGRIYAKDSSGFLSFGLSKTTSGAGGIFYTPSIYVYNTTYLIVLKYSFNELTGTDDQVSLFVFSSFVPSAEPAPAIGPLTGTGADLNDAGRLSLRQGSTSSSPDLYIDGIFVTTNWDNNALPVELNYFTSNIINRDVFLNWSTSSELNNSGFKIERSTGSGDWYEIGFVEGYGNTSVRHDYSFSDKSLKSGKYSYRLKQIDFNGNFENFKLNGEIIISFPDKFKLFQNYPNPFNPVTRIDFEIPFDAEVTLILFDVSGKEIYTAINGNKTSGYHTLILNAASIGNGLSSGIYFYRFTAVSKNNIFIESKKMIVSK